MVADEGQRSSTGEQSLDDVDVLTETSIPFVVRKEVPQRRLMTQGGSNDHIEVYSPAIKLDERGDRLRNGKRMHVDRIHRNKWGNQARPPEQLLSGDPWFKEAVIAG